MTLYLAEDDVRALLPMSDAVPLAATLFASLGLGRATNHPRRRHKVEGGMLNVMDAAWPDGGVMGLKAYTAFRDANRFHVMLYSARDGRLLAILEADWLGRLRTGAMSGVATDLLARPDARTLAVIGTGGQARTQVEAVAQVRALSQVRAFSRTPERRDVFAREMTAKLGIPVVAVGSAEEAVRGADLVTTATWAKDPVVRGEWLSPGAHVNAIGANLPTRRELDEEAVRRAAHVVVDHRETARIESGDLLQAKVDLDKVRELGELCAGLVKIARAEGDVTLFKSHGVALLDVGAAAFVLGRALETGRGRRL